MLFKRAGVWQRIEGEVGRHGRVDGGLHLVVVAGGSGNRNGAEQAAACVSIGYVAADADAFVLT